jgi:hypothetical protein
VELGIHRGQWWLDGGVGALGAHVASPCWAPGGPGVG